MVPFFFKGSVSIIYYYQGKQYKPLFKVDWFVKTILCYFLDALTIYNITQKV